MGKYQLEAITLYRPWPWAILALNKNVENRNWMLDRPPGTWLALHAETKWDSEGVEFIERINPSHEALISLPPKSEHPTGLVGMIQFGGNVTDSNSEWFTGPIGWKIDDQFELSEPISYPGSPGLWQLPDELLPRMRDEYRAYQRRHTWE